MVRPIAVLQIAAERLKREYGIDMIRVPYKSTPQAMTDVIGGNLTMTFVDVAAALSAVKSGQVRAIAISSATRTPLMPDVARTMQGAWREGLRSHLLERAVRPGQDAGRYCCRVLARKPPRS